ncbi:MAG TPA: hypothetical protein VE079_15865 [Ensifer sp.]|nr:hypothetical protein [Ensifer sp.]
MAEERAITLVPSADTSAVVAAIERARALFDDGDVQAAMMLSGAAYEQAKAAAGYAAKVKASRQLIDKARRMQADALKIETDCTIKLADEVDAAQSAGAVLSHGQNRKVNGRKADTQEVQSSDLLALDDIGIDKRRLAEWRKIRDAERDAPGTVDRIIETRISAGLEPSRNSLRTAIGTRTATKEEKGDQLYETPECAIRTLLALESFSPTVWEPACGRGAIVRPLEAAGYEVIISDLVDRGTATKDGELQGVGDFLDSVATDGEGPDILTNPPYDELANRFAAHALRVHRPRKMALLLNLNFLAGFDDPERCFVMDECPPARIYVFTHRLPMMHRDGWDGPKASSSMNTAWFVWEQRDDGTYGQPGDTRMIRVLWDHWQNEPALAPGDGVNGAGRRIDISSIIFETSDDEGPRTTPRLSLEERVAMNVDEAAEWMAGAGDFDAGQLRRAIGIRDTTARAIIEALWKQERIVCVTNVDGEKWRWA